MKLNWPYDVSVLFRKAICCFFISETAKVERNQRNIYHISGINHETISHIWDNNEVTKNRYIALEQLQVWDAGLEYSCKFLALILMLYNYIQPLRNNL